MRKKHADTLKAIFHTPVLSNVKWSDIESLFISLGANVSEGRGSRVKICLNDRVSVFHRPHPQKETDLTFQKYGDTGYLQTLSIEGETDGLEFPRTKAEAKAETMAKNTNGNTKVVEQAMLVSGK